MTERIDLISKQMFDRQRCFLWYLVVLVVCGLLYVVTCAPGLVWQDSGMIQYRLWHNDIEGGLGLALAHPLFYLLAIGAKSIPLGEFAVRVNLVSAVTAALAVSNLFLLLYLWQGLIIPSLVGAGSLAVSHTFWRHAAIPETYNLYVALLLMELIFLLQYIRTKQVRYLYGLALFNGLAVADHMLGSISCFVYVCLGVVLLWRRVIPFKAAAILIGCWLIGALPYVYLIVKNIVQTGDVGTVLHSAAFGNQWQGAVLNTKLTGTIVKQNLMFIFYNFPTPNIVLLAIGLYAAWRKFSGLVFGRIAIVLLLFYLLFAFRYTIVDRYAFFIPFYGFVALFIGLGGAYLIQRFHSKVMAAVILLMVFVPVPVYAFAPSFLEEKGMALGMRREVPYRNNYSYFLQPWKTGYEGADRFGLEALAGVEEKAIIYADGTTVYPLLLTQQVKGIRPDVVVASRHGTVNNLDTYGAEFLDSLPPERAVYVVSPVKGYCPSFLLERYEFEKQGLLYRGIKK